MSSLKIRDVMARPVVTVRRHATFKEIVGVLHEHGISGVPVVDDDGATVIGIVTEADLLAAEEGEEPARARRGSAFAWLLHPAHAKRIRERADGTTAADLMRSPVVTVSPDTSIGAATRRLLEARVKRLPVVDAEGRIAGIVSRRDLLEPFLRDDSEIRDEIEREILHRVSWDGSPRIEVTVLKGEVLLAGTIRRRSEEEILVKLVSAVAGVIHVDDTDLAFELDDRTVPSPEAFMPHPDLPGRPPPSSI